MGRAADLFVESVRRGLEGIVIKRLDSTYRPPDGACSAPCARRPLESSLETRRVALARTQPEVGALAPGWRGDAPVRLELGVYVAPMLAATATPCPRAMRGQPS